MTDRIGSFYIENEIEQSWPIWQGIWSMTKNKQDNDVTNFSTLDLSNRSNTILFKNWYFRVKILTFRFGCSQTSKSKCWRQSWSCWKSRKPIIFNPMTQPCSWHTFGGEGNEGGGYGFLSLWMVENKSCGNPNPLGVFIGLLIGFKWLKPTWAWVT